MSSTSCRRGQLGNVLPLWPLSLVTRVLTLRSQGNLDLPKLSELDFVMKFAFSLGMLTLCE